MTKKVFFVTGPEGSGTYMMAEALRLSGVEEVLRGELKYGAYYSYVIESFPDLVWMHRSMPSAGIWIDWAYAKSSFETYDYKTIPIFMTREFNATYLSQKRRDSSRSRRESEVNIRNAYSEISHYFPNDFIPVSYEAFCSSEGFRQWLFVERFGLPMTTIEVRDENSKYYE